MHTPVLLNEVLALLSPKPGDFMVDATLGSAGHAQAIIDRLSPNGTLLGLDWDDGVVSGLGESLMRYAGDKKVRLSLMTSNYRNLPEILNKNKSLGSIDGLLLDLGFSSMQVSADSAVQHGMSFLINEPLSMTYNSGEKSLSSWLNELSENELATIISSYSNERYAAKIAASIKESLPVNTTFELVEAVKRAVPRSYERGRLHPATRTFQALRIFVNQEYENIRSVLDALPGLMSPQGRVVVITFHSGEDAIVKKIFRQHVNSNQALLLTKKPLKPARSEIQKNPRSRSAKIRAIKFK